MSYSVSTVDVQGSGRVFIVISEGGTYEIFATEVHRALATRCKSILIKCSEVTENNWQTLAHQFEDRIRQQGVRQASLVGFGAATTLTQNLCLWEPKLARTMILVDSTTRPHPGLMTRAIDTIEEFLPLGLPLRSAIKGFDAKPFLQRIRCPVLVVNSTYATPHVLRQAHLLLNRLPAAWFVDLRQCSSPTNEIEALTEQVLAFQEVPARCPQRGSVPPRVSLPTD